MTFWAKTSLCKGNGDCRPYSLSQTRLLSILGEFVPWSAMGIPIYVYKEASLHHTSLISSPTDSNIHQNGKGECMWRGSKQQTELRWPRQVVSVTECLQLDAIRSLSQMHRPWHPRLWLSCQVSKTIWVAVGILVLICLVFVSLPPPSLEKHPISLFMSNKF